jgi:hypothetical protein
MPFGKYRDTDITQIKKGYLKWVLKNLTLDPSLRQDIEDVLDGKPLIVKPSIDEQVHSIVGYLE